MNNPSGGASHKYLENLEQRERESGGNDTLKITLMRCIVVIFKLAKGKPSTDSLCSSSNFKNAERYIIPELKRKI